MYFITYLIIVLIFFAYLSFNEKPSKGLNVTLAFLWPLTLIFVIFYYTFNAIEYLVMMLRNAVKSS